MDGLYYYKLVSPYPEDVTKNCKLSINEIDHNFLTLKDFDIKTAEFVRDEKTLVLTRNNGEKLIVPLKDVTYNLNVTTECGESGVTLTISYDGTEGKKEITIANILTADNLMEIIGSDILTRVITDGTLKGNGTIDSPLGIAGVEKTGMYAPVKAVYDLTTGGTLPEVAKLGTRYVTKEYVNDYGYLYNGAGVKKIQDKLDEAYDQKNKKRQLYERRYGWRVPTKADWDALLNSLEPCEYQNHNSAKCHIELGKYAGKFLKSECGWLGQPDCDCTITKPNTGCTWDDESYVSDGTGYTEGDMPSYNPESPVGVDKYGMSILPAGVGSLDSHGRPQAFNFKEQAVFWTTTPVYNDPDQDVYTKIFDWNKGGVTQVAECPNPYFSVRLVKDYDGSNYFDTEYIDGIPYKTILFPESGQIWLASNYASKEGFVQYEPGGATPEVMDVNNGEILEKRTELFINEWNGTYWEKKIMHEGDTVVVENPCFDQSTGSTTTITWIDKEGVEHCVDVEIPKKSQSNLEYRVYTDDEGCNKTLVNTDDLVIERIVQIIVPMLEQEREERIEGDMILSGMIETERQERISADTELFEAIQEEISARTEADNELWEALSAETEARISGDTYLERKIDDETERAMEAERQLRDDLNTEITRAINEEARIEGKLDDEIRRSTREDELLWEALSAETNARIEGDAALSGAIDDERAERISADTVLENAILDEIDRATAREDEIDGQLIDWNQNPFTMSASTIPSISEYNLILKTKDDNPDHSIKVTFDGSFGEI